MPQLFTFALDRLGDIEPWGPPDAPVLSWFGLSYGEYAMTIGGRRVFTYDESALLARGWTAGDTCVHYQVARLWEDLVSALPWILVPVPPDIVALIEPRLDTHGLRWLGRRIDDLELRDGALGFLGRRTISSPHLVDGPSLHLLLRQDEVLVEFDGRGDAPLWSPAFAKEWMPIGAFLAEVRSFDAALMRAMALRVEACVAGALSHVLIDPEALVGRQEECAETLEANLQSDRALSYVDDWNAVRAALRAIC